MVLVTLCHNAALLRADPTGVLSQQAPDTSMKEDIPTVVDPSNPMMSIVSEKRDPSFARVDRFSPVGPSYNAHLYAYPQLYADIAEILRPRKRSAYDSAYYDNADPYVIKKEMPGVLRFGKRRYSSAASDSLTTLMQQEKKAVPGVLRFGKRGDNMPGVLRFGKRAYGEGGDMPGVLRFGKREPGMDMPGVLRFGKRGDNMPGVLRFGKRMEGEGIPGVLRFGKRMEGDIPGVLRFGKRMEGDIPGVLRFGKKRSDNMPGVLRFGKRGDNMPGVLRFGK